MHDSPFTTISVSRSLTASSKRTTVAGDERQALHKERRAGVLQRASAPPAERHAEAVGYASRVQPAEVAGEFRRVADGLNCHLTAEPGEGPPGAVEVVLPRDVRQRH